ncbi:MAG: basic amino acid ABC transporter substrate-binding protein [Neisseriaceae bacterium]|nr:basic amino acid ABC transporter substrate-binding protein [Neisseriaceae bacterium]
MNLKHFFATCVVGLALTACNNSSTSTDNETTAQLPDAKEVKTLRVASNAEFAPFEYTQENGDIVGFDIDLINAMADAGGFKVEIQNTPWEGIFTRLNSGDSDVLLSAITITDERKQTMDFTNPYFEIHQLIMTTENSDIQSLEDLKNNKKVGVVTGQTGDLAISAMLGATNDKISRYDSVILAVKALQNGAVDAIVSDSATVETYAKNNPETKFVLIQSDQFEREDYGMATRKGDAETLQMLNDALGKVRSNGKYDEIYNKYFAQNAQESQTPQATPENNVAEEPSVVLEKPGELLEEPREMTIEEAPPPNFPTTN